MSDNPVKDFNLTRWNRAGLQRFRYIDGNAATYLEHIRGKLADHFPDWEFVQKEIPEDETRFEKLNRITDQYFETRQDWAWEIARAFSRSTHILTEHMDAFANEGYLSTATQWEYLRRLVSMLGYHPRPPASASTTIAIIAKDDKEPGFVPKGFQVKYSPEDGSKPVIFETLNDIKVDKNLSAIRLSDWDQNRSVFDPFSPITDAFWAVPEKVEVSVGQPVILEQGGLAEIVKISAVNEDVLAITPHDTSLSRSYRLNSSHLLIDADNIYSASLNGPNTIRVPEGSGLAVDDVVAWKNAAADETGFARIVETDKFGIKVTDIRPRGANLNQAGIDIYATRLTSRDQFLANGNKWLFPLGTTAGLILVGSNRSGSLRSTIITKPNFSKVNDEGLPVTDTNGRIASSESLNGFTGHDLYYFNPDSDVPIAVSDSRLPQNQFDIEGGVGKLLSGDFLVAEAGDGEMAAIRISEIVEREDSFTLTVVRRPAGLANIIRFHGPFTTEVRPKGFDRNPVAADPAALTLETDDAAILDYLVPGKLVLIEPENELDTAEPFTATITEVVTAGRSKTKKRIKTGSDILTSRPRLVLDADVGLFQAFTRGNLIIRGNAVNSGHGESKPKAILGSGDASQINQSFRLEKEKVAFIADTVLESGVRAAISIDVNGRTYEEVSVFSDSEAADPHYTVRLTEEGHIDISFGDGFNGRRLPTGRNNIAIEYRVGTGSEGNNIDAGGLEKAVKPNPFVDAIRQPIATTGGEDMEDSDGIRENAPDYLRSLGRGVSLADFQHLAKNTPGVWHAKAFLNPDGANKEERVEITIVPADGGILGDLGSSIQTRLISLSPPNILFSVTRFDDVLLPIKITIRVNSDEYKFADVEAQVRQAVYEHFQLSVRLPGQPVYLSEAFQIVEAIPGVINSDISLFPGIADPIISTLGDPLTRVSRGGKGEVWAAWPSGKQVIYIDQINTIEIIEGELVDS